MFTVDGVYRSRGWTEWTQGFQFGAPLLQFDATCDREFLELGRSHTLERMAPHLTHVGVHDHGFNNVSTYGNLWRLAREGKFEAEAWELRFYALALKVTGAVQARRWTPIPGGGFIYSFNGAHSLFVDTIRTLRALALSHVLGHRLFEEQDVQVNLLERLLQHARATAEYSVYFGKGRDSYDVRGRTAHESLFNAANGTYRGPSSQQGYSPFSTWTRGLAWAMLGFAEQLEFLETIDPAELARLRNRTGTGTDPSLRGGGGDVRFLHRSRGGGRRRSVLGYRRAGTGGARRLGIARSRSVQRSRAGRQLGGRDRRAGAASAGARGCGSRRRRHTVRTGGTACARHADR